jgi:hypothetical protein
MSTRQRQEDKHEGIKRTQIGKQSFVGYAAKLWNQAPDVVMILDVNK